jgi:flagellar FliL protein
MAEDRETPQKQKARKAEEAEPKRAPRGKLAAKLIGAALAVALLGGGSLMAWRHFGPSQQAAEASAEPAEVLGQTYRLEQFVVNLVDPLGRRYLKVQLELEMENPQAVQEAGRRNAQIRDSIITLLSSKSYGDIDSPEGKLQLRREIIARVNQFLHHGKAINAYFTDFVIQ